MNNRELDFFVEQALELFGLFLRNAQDGGIGLVFVFAHFQINGFLAEIDGVDIFLCGGRGNIMRRLINLGGGIG